MSASSKDHTGRSVVLELHNPLGHGRQGLDSAGVMLERDPRIKQSAVAFQIL